MKKNLSIFANSVAERAGLNWEVKPSEHAGRGELSLQLNPFLKLMSYTRPNAHSRMKRAINQLTYYTAFLANSHNLLVNLTILKLNLGSQKRD